MVSYVEHTLPRKIKPKFDFAEIERKHRRDGFTVVNAGSKRGYYYMSENTKPCPECGSQPMIEPFVNDPSVYVAICPKCGLRAEGEGTPEECVETWNARRFSELSVKMLTRPESWDFDGLTNLAGAVMRGVKNDYVSMFRKERELRDQAKLLPDNSPVRALKLNSATNLRRQQVVLERYIRHTAFLLKLDRDAFIDMCRREA